MTDIVEKDYAALGHFAESTGKFWWENGHWVAEPPTDMVVEKAVAAKDAEIEALRKEVERLTRERDIAIGERVARSKTMAKLRNRLSMIRLDDEIDRVYFRSTNDADAFRDLVQEIEEWKWHDIMRESQQSDPFEASRKAHERADKAGAENARMREAGEQLYLCANAIVGADPQDPRSQDAFEMFDKAKMNWRQNKRAVLQGDGE